MGDRQEFCPNMYEKHFNTSLKTVHVKMGKIEHNLFNVEKENYKLRLEEAY